MFGLLVLLSSAYSIASRIDNNNFHLGFLRKTKEEEEEEEEERERERGERHGCVWVPSALDEREKESFNFRLKVLS